MVFGSENIAKILHFHTKNTYIIFTIFSYVNKKKDSYQNYLIMMFYDAVYQFILTQIVHLFILETQYLKIKISSISCSTLYFSNVFIKLFSNQIVINKKVYLIN